YPLDLVVLSDHRPLQWITTSNSAKVQRWLLAMSQYSFTVRYVEGKVNKAADALSRLRTAPTDEFLEQLPSAPAAAAVSGDDDDVPWPFPRLPASCRPACVLSIAEHWSREDIVRQQNDDPIIAEVRERRQDPQPLARTEFKIPPLRPYKKLWNVLDVADNVLVRLAHFLPEDEARWVPVVASSVRQEVMQHFHEHDGHFGRDRNLEKLRRLCYWPTMAEDVAEHVAACQQCQIAKGHRPPVGPAMPLPIGTPWRTVAVDFLTVAPAPDGISKLLVVVDHFTKWADAFP
ncbi:hypothetical protein FOZ63_015615, partial [Perkinsus olseni]